MRRLLPVLAVGALTTAGLGLAAGPVLSSSPITPPRTAAVPTGATAAALGFAWGVLGLQQGDQAAIVAIEHTADPALARQLLADAAGHPRSELRPATITALGTSVVDTGHVVVVVSARLVDTGGATTSVAWPLRVIRHSGHWIVTGMAPTWAG